MLSNYFSSSRKRKAILEKLELKRLIVNNFWYPLGIMPDENYPPTEGTTVQFNATEIGDMYMYNISVSSNRLYRVFLNILKLFPSYITMVIERVSEDVNRDYDVLLSDPDISLKEAKRVFKRYKELWLECGFVGFGIMDEATGFEVFINVHKEIEMTVPTKYINKLNKILNRFSILDNDKVIFISDLEHWHYSLSSLASYTGCSEAEEYMFDYYDIVNNLKHRYGFSILNLNESNFSKPPRWWNVTIKGLGKCQNRTFVSTYYIVASTVEEMETLIDEHMLDLKVEYYYIYDYYNVDPNIYLNEDVPIIKKPSVAFENAPFGIWGESDIFICGVKNLASYYINKPYASAR